jgi:hypothetical protein
VRPVSFHGTLGLSTSDEGIPRDVARGHSKANKAAVLAIPKTIMFTGIERKKVQYKSVTPMYNDCGKVEEV